MNVSASDQAREYSPTLPHFLRNRPLHVVKHCCKRWEEADNIPVADIDILRNTSFLVRSQSGDNTRRFYHVNFQPDHSGLPSCDCRDWKAIHLLCKHFMAIFRHIDNCKWEQLPHAYRNSPFVNLDLETFESTEGTDKLFSENVYDDDEEVTVNTNQCVRSAILDLPVSLSAVLKGERANIGSLCEIIKDFSYKCPDINILQDLSQQLTSALTNLKKSLPQTKEFILDNSSMTHIGTNKPKKTKRNPINYL